MSRANLNPRAVARSCVVGKTKGGPVTQNLETREVVWPIFPIDKIQLSRPCAAPAKTAPQNPTGPTADPLPVGWPSVTGRWNFHIQCAVCVGARFQLKPETVARRAWPTSGVHVDARGRPRPPRHSLGLQLEACSNAYGTWWMWKFHLTVTDGQPTGRGGGGLWVFLGGLSPLTEDIRSDARSFCHCRPATAARPTPCRWVGPPTTVRWNFQTHHVPYALERARSRSPRLWRCGAPASSLKP